ncbi:hypothetical protein AMECASPLE_000942 [Ameca splendens]|uniref:Uncharacterized protein n=1 Tax=Ameca splendens TaxID=208324 RepID=A0ABV0Z6Q0_9TELE
MTINIGSMLQYLSSSCVNAVGVPNMCSIQIDEHRIAHAAIFFDIKIHNFSHDNQWVFILGNISNVLNLSFFLSEVKVLQPFSIRLTCSTLQQVEICQNCVNLNRLLLVDTDFCFA